MGIYVHMYMCIYVDPKSTPNRRQHRSPNRPKIGPESTSNRPRTESEVGGRFWTPFWLRLLPSWVVLGALGASLEGILGPSRSVLRRLGAILGRSWGRLGPHWAILGRLGAILGRLGAVLEPSWGRLGSSWKHRLQKLPKVKKHRNT